MRACACGERKKATCAMRGNMTSLTNCARPCVSRARFGRGTERPMYELGRSSAVRQAGCRRRFSFARSRPLLCYRLDGVDDGLVTGTAAVVAGDMVADSYPCPAQHRHAAALRGEQHARRAVAALQRITPLECRLQVGDFAGVGNTSMVSTRAPSHCTARRRQPRTTSPSTRTVHEPQMPCSQPTWLPVSERVSRRKSTSVRRGSTLSCTVFAIDDDGDVNAGHEFLPHAGSCRYRARPVLITSRMRRCHRCGLAERRGAQMAGEFAGKIVVVTGGSRGIGRGIATAFAREGARR